ncbi:MAG: UDP-3-O-acyl-N-acetylglucosamine deacetylase [Desulfobacteraceae bacterium]
MTLHTNQRTLARSTTCRGIGVHSGKQVNLTIRPAPINHGIKFHRIDLPGTPCVTAHFNRVVDTSLATVIGEEGCIISTIEHLMAAFTGLSIDNAIVEVDSYELPIMDGSAGPFTTIMKKAGIIEQDRPRFFFVIKKAIELHKNGKSVCVYPAQETKITYTIEYQNQLISTQTASFLIDELCFEKEIANARTFGFLHEYEYMQKFGLAKGASLDNAVVIDNDKVINPDGLRYDNEFVRHKILDCIGDFSLLGMPMLGHIVLKKSGHEFNHAFLEKFFAEKESWDTMSITNTIPVESVQTRKVAV